MRALPLLAHADESDPIRAGRDLQKQLDSLGFEIFVYVQGQPGDHAARSRHALRETYAHQVISVKQPDERQ
jgi:hypothetical protein